MVTTTNGIYLYNCTLNKYDLVTNFQSSFMLCRKMNVPSLQLTNQFGSHLSTFCEFFWKRTIYHKFTILKKLPKNEKK
jgi:hypothetical protein